MKYTFALVKSGALKRGALSSIILAMHNNSFTILAERFRWLNKTDVEFLYASHMEKPYWYDLTTSVNAGAYLMVLANAAQPDYTVEAWRLAMTGRTTIADEEVFLKGPSLRDLYKGPKTAPTADNALHGSDSNERAHAEIAYFFPNFTMGD